MSKSSSELDKALRHMEGWRGATDEEKSQTDSDPLHAQNQRFRQTIRKIHGLATEEGRSLDARLNLIQMFAEKALEEDDPRMPYSEH